MRTGEKELCTRESSGTQLFQYRIRNLQFSGARAQVNVDVYKRQVFAIAPDGDLTFINKVDIDGMRGCHLSTDEAVSYTHLHW